MSRFGGTASRSCVVGDTPWVAVEVGCGAERMGRSSKSTSTPTPPPSRRAWPQTSAAAHARTAKRSSSRRPMRQMPHAAAPRAMVAIGEADAAAGARDSVAIDGVESAELELPAASFAAVLRAARALRRRPTRTRGHADTRSVDRDIERGKGGQAYGRRHEGRRPQGSCWPVGELEERYGRAC